MRIDHASFHSSLLLSRLADQILLFLVPLVVYQLTKDAAWSGVAFFVETLPRYLSFPICGALCDRVSPFKLLRVSQLLRAVTCIVGAFGSLATGNVICLVTVSALCGVFTTQGLMAREVMIPQVFNGFKTEKVIAHTQIADQLGMVSGPLIAAFALEFWSWPIVLACTAILFLIADFAMKIWRYFSTVQLVESTLNLQRGRLPLLQPYRTALNHVLRLPGLLRLIFLTAGVNLVIGVTLATSAAMMTGVYGESSSYYALLQTGGAVATVIVLLTISHFNWRIESLGLVSYSCILVGGLLMACSGFLSGYIFGFLLVVGFDKMFNVYIRTRRMEIIPRADLGKTTGVIVLLNNLSQPVAGMCVGIFASHYSTHGVILAMAIGMGIVGCIVICLKQSHV